ncbi:MAG: IS200/IS605 family transposase [Bacteroidales bacterium]|nr:IS200/IS605 family transposase [Bacteroidales bacterium]
MATTFISVYIHFVFSTKKRQKIIEKKMRSMLWAYMGGIAKQNKMVALAVGGTDNHAHLLVSIPGAYSPAKAVQLIKAGSSKWVHEEFPSMKGFSWQVGYSGFSVSPKRVQSVIDYINNQEEHHKARSFEQEYIAFLKSYGLEFDEKFVLDD